MTYDLDKRVEHSTSKIKSILVARRKISSASGASSDSFTIILEKKKKYISEMIMPAERINSCINTSSYHFYLD